MDQNKSCSAWEQQREINDDFPWDKLHHNCNYNEGQGVEQTQNSSVNKDFIFNLVIAEL